jgi:hypothetical protein
MVFAWIIYAFQRRAWDNILSRQQLTVTHNGRYHIEKVLYQDEAKETFVSLRKQKYPDQKSFRTIQSDTADSMLATGRLDPRCGD